MMNIYLDSSHMALKYLKDTEVNHSSHSDLLFDITDSFNLGLSELTNQVLTKYSNNN